ncbi:MAG: carboxypeptidase regulatory-like domain-containing protein [Ekhidna sp.]
MKLLIFLSTFIFNTSVDTSSDQLLPTKLKVTVIDGLGNFVEGAQVLIYENEVDYLASENPVEIAKTDKKGHVTFKEVMNIAYFIEAKQGDKNNDGEGVVTGKLSEGKVNKVNTVIE